MATYLIAVAGHKVTPESRYWCFVTHGCGEQDSRASDAASCHHWREVSDRHRLSREAHGAGCAISELPTASSDVGIVNSDQWCPSAAHLAMSCLISESFLMRMYLSTLPRALSCLLLCGVAAADEPKPFIQFPDPAGSYLKRIHAKDAAPRAPLAFRPDYPGGHHVWQKDARRKLAELLGLVRMRRENAQHKPIVRLLDRPVQEDGYTRQRGEIETEPSVTIPFWLLTPLRDATKPLPLVICAHGHDSDGWNTYAGVFRDDAHRKSTLAKDGDIGVQAVRRGFVTLVPATRGLAEAASIPDVKGRHGARLCRAQLIHCLLAGRTAVGERVWDTQRLVDWALAELPGIDHGKVALTGNSGGGVLTVYAAALDERITVAVPSCSFTSYTSSTGFIFHCDCCLIPRAQVELGDMADIGALTAPRPLLAVHGRQDGLHHEPDVEAAMARVRLIYKSAGADGQFEHRWGNSGHKFYPKIMWPFIEAAFKKERIQ